MRLRREGFEEDGTSFKSTRQAFLEAHAEAEKARKQLAAKAAQPAKTKKQKAQQQLQQQPGKQSSQVHSSQAQLAVMEGWQYLAWWMRLLRNSMAHEALIRRAGARMPQPKDFVLETATPRQVELLSSFPLKMQPDAAANYLSGLVGKWMHQTGQPLMSQNDPPAQSPTPTAALSGWQPRHPHRHPHPTRARHLQMPQVRQHSPRFRRAVGLRTHSHLRMQPPTTCTSSLVSV